MADQGNIRGRSGKTMQSGCDDILPEGKTIQEPDENLTEETGENKENFRTAEVFKMYTFWEKFQFNNFRDYPKKEVNFVDEMPII